MVTCCELPMDKPGVPSSMTTDFYPGRIVCMTEETTETLYLLGEQDRIVGISGFTVRPPRARKEKPKVSAFTSAKIDKILALDPDLVLGFSDMQAEIAADLVRRGVAVFVFNHRSVQGILQMICTVGALVGRQHEAEALALRFEQDLTALANLSNAGAPRPRVYFEEWPDPMICGIRWVSELIEMAGGEDVFADRAVQSLGKDRIVTSDLVLGRHPDIIIGSWCGRKFRPETVATRPGWDVLPAVIDRELHEIKSSEILQPGPAALTDGLARLTRIIQQWKTRTSKR